MVEAHSNRFAISFGDFDNRSFNNSSAAELEHKWQKQFHNICVLMGVVYGMLFLYTYANFKIEYREVQLAESKKNNSNKKWHDLLQWK